MIEFTPIGGIPVDGVPVVIPFSNWLEAANWPQYTDQPRKI